MPVQSSHIDIFAHHNLPTFDLLTDFKLCNFQKPGKLNAGHAMKDDMVEKVYNDHIAFIENLRQFTFKGLGDLANRITHVLLDDLGVVPGQRVR